MPKYKTDDLTLDHPLFHEGKPVVIMDERNPEGSYKTATYAQLAAAWDKLGTTRCRIEDWTRGRRFEHLTVFDMAEKMIQALEDCRVVFGHVGRFIDGFEEPPNDGRYIEYVPGRSITDAGATKPDKPRFKFKRTLRRNHGLHH